ncbi:MAG TPA: NAD(P)-dependent alcohol dehydrogenase [Methanomassiliicoccales archaeon]|nr:NAD(P)-dependent alcohol dehydrogenase [Methanomassiliicoccales archaeon]
MKAVVCTRYGPPSVLRIEEAEKPAPKDGEVLIKVRAASLNRVDWILMRGKPALIRLMGGGLLHPKHRIPGGDVAGVVEAVGPGVTRFNPGDEVFGNLKSSGRGAYAEFVCGREDALVLKPSNVTFEEAASVPTAGLTALIGMREQGQIRAGQKVLVHGASGGVGSFALQIAKALGANVTAVCSTKHVEAARSMGADRVIDYTKQDFAQSGERYDLIIGANGNRSIFEYRRCLKPNGTYVMLGGRRKQISQAFLLGRMLSRKEGKKLTFLGSWDVRASDLELLGEMLESRKIVPVIDHRYTLGHIRDAMRYLGEFHAGGKVVISVTEEGLDDPSGLSTMTTHETSDRGWTGCS